MSGQELSIDEVSAGLKASAGGPIELLKSDDCWPVFGWNGWQFCVFDDCGDFDYLEWVQAPDGRRWESYEGDESQEASDGTYVHNVQKDHALFVAWQTESRKHWSQP